MTERQWNAFSQFKLEFAKKVLEWTDAAPELQELQKTAAELARTPFYSFETPVVYNRALDMLTKNDEIKLIVIGDNPGKDEQLLKNNRYLVGQAGKIAENWFKKNQELGIDFRKNAIILNKTPIHSAKTNQLKTIKKLGGEKISALLDETQLWMAEKTAWLHDKLCSGAEENQRLPEMWLVGYSELKQNGIFCKYRDMLKKCENNWESVYVFQHFSMNRFTIDFENYKNIDEQKKSQPLEKNIHDLGIIHKREIFG